MADEIARYNVRMPMNIAKVFNTFALLLGYKKSTFVFSCAIDGLIQKVGQEEYLDMIMAMNGDLLPEPSVDAKEKPERRGSVNVERPQRSGREENRSGRTTFTGSCPSGMLEASMDGVGSEQITTIGDTATGEFQR